MNPKNIIDNLKFDRDGLVTAVIQDVQNGDVLMVAHMNREAVIKTLEGPHTHFWSRSRNKLWMKGETSGHTQKICEIRLDCDGDALLIKVEQNGVACHEGTRSCFSKMLVECF